MTSTLTSITPPAKPAPKDFSTAELATLNAISATLSAIFAQEEANGVTLASILAQLKVKA